MINKEQLIKHIEEMPIDELQSAICKALEDSGIKYKIGGEPEEGFLPLSEFFHEGWFTEGLNEWKNNQ